VRIEVLNVSLVGIKNEKELDLLEIFRIRTHSSAFTYS